MSQNNNNSDLLFSLAYKFWNDEKTPDRNAEPESESATMKEELSRKPIDSKIQPISVEVSEENSVPSAEAKSITQFWLDSLEGSQQMGTAPVVDHWSKHDNHGWAENWQFDDSGRVVRFKDCSGLTWSRISDEIFRSSDGGERFAHVSIGNGMCVIKTNLD